MREEQDLVHAFAEKENRPSAATSLENLKRCWVMLLVLPMTGRYILSNFLAGSGTCSSMQYACRLATVYTQMCWVCGLVAETPLSVIPHLRVALLFPSGKATITFALSSALNISRLTKQEGTAS